MAARRHSPNPAAGLGRAGLRRCQRQQSFATCAQSGLASPPTAAWHPFASPQQPSHPQVRRNAAHLPSIRLLPTALVRGDTRETARYCFGDHPSILLSLIPCCVGSEPGRTRARRAVLPLCSSSPSSLLAPSIYHGHPPPRVSLTRAQIILSSTHNYINNNFQNFNLNLNLHLSHQALQNHHVSLRHLLLQVR